jgi:hypothetical protein
MTSRFNPIVATKRSALPQKYAQHHQEGTNTSEDHKHNEHNRWRSIGIFIAIFSGGLLVMVAVFSQFPDIEKDHWDYIKLPRSLDDAKDLGRVLSHYRESHYFSVLLVLVCTYILYPFN